MTPADSVTHCLGKLRDGDESAAEFLWDRYFQRLVRLAQSRLAGRLPQRAADAEDVALSAFATFCRRTERGEVRPGDRDNLWALLARITVRKAALLVRHECRQKRGGGAVRGESIWMGNGDQHDDEGGIEQVLDSEPTPEIAAAVTDECARLLECLQDPVLRTVALHKLEGYNNDEIAVRLDVTTRTVERKLEAIREIWNHEGDAR